MFEKVNPGHPDKMADRLEGMKVKLTYIKAEEEKNDNEPPAL